MDDKFLFGVILGVLGGAVLVTNSIKARQIVKDGQNQVQKKLDDMKENAKKNQEN